MRNLFRTVHSGMETFLWVPMTFLLGFLGLSVYWAFDRAPASAYRDHAHATILSPGHLELRYELERFRTDCDLKVNRFIAFNGSFRQYYPETKLSAEQLAILAASTPNEVRILLQIPTHYVIGDRGVYSVELEYYCNPLHYLFPIVNRFDVEFVAEHGPADSGLGGPGEINPKEAGE